MTPDIPLPTAEEARRIRFEPFTPLAEIFGTEPEAINADPAAYADLLRSMPYEAYLKTEHWRATRAAALERAGHSCQVCSRTNDLQVHHRSYANRGAEQPQDLTALCNGCHGTFHEHGKLAA